MTIKKVLEVFKDYIAADDSCEVLETSRGYLVVDWDSTADRWVTSRLCKTPQQLRDALRTHYEDYQGYTLTGGYKRELLPSEEEDIKRMGEAIAERCSEN